jgi:hypothetical protein
MQLFWYIRSFIGEIEAGLQIDVGAFMLPFVSGLDTGVGFE